MKTFTIILALFALVCAVAACGSGANVAPSNRAKPAPHAHGYHPPVPDAYKDRKPPAGMSLTDAAVIARGKELFESPDAGNCISCHGNDGKGGGPLGANLDPKPGNLTDPEVHEHVSDAYIFWRIQTGNAGWGNHDGKVSGMLGYTKRGTDDEWDRDCWALTAYVRSLNGK
ncbi:MAG: c-type cytochrome [Planctomycetes bacterium]|nr:c-type cytochrome [Planctomycetota bacterium]MCW8135971.1 c-type cytochrome [Planctomycetota bacterium]